MPDDSKIKKAAKRLEGALVQVYFRGGEVCKIPAQKVEMPLKEGIQDIKVIPADIVED